MKTFEQFLIDYEPNNGWYDQGAAQEEYRKYCATNIPGGPTLNQTYNRLLLSWAAQGHPSAPECEECGCDLTGQPVIETPTLWLCNACASLDEYYDDTDDEHYLDYSGRRDPDREDFHSDG